MPTDYTPGDQFRAFVMQEVERIRHTLGLQDWRINIHFVEAIDPDANDPTGYTAEIENDHTYFESELFLSRKLEAKFDAGRPDYVIEDLCHELVHILTDGPIDYAEQFLPEYAKRDMTRANERMTQRIAMLVVRLAGRKGDIDLDTLRIKNADGL